MNYWNTFILIFLFLIIKSSFALSNKFVIQRPCVETSSLPSITYSVECHSRIKTSFECTVEDLAHAYIHEDESCNDEPEELNECINEYSYRFECTDTPPDREEGACSFKIEDDNNYYFEIIFKPNECFLLNDESDIYGIFFTDIDKYIVYYECDNEDCTDNCIKKYIFDVSEGDMMCVKIDSFDYYVINEFLEEEIVISQTLVNETTCLNRHQQKCIIDNKESIIVRDIEYNDEGCSVMENVDFKVLTNDDNIQYKCLNNEKLILTPENAEHLVVFNYRSLEDCENNVNFEPRLYNLEIESVDDKGSREFTYFKKNGDKVTLCVNKDDNDCNPSIDDIDINFDICVQVDPDLFDSLNYIRITQYLYIRRILKGYNTDNTPYTEFTSNHYYQCHCDIMGNVECENPDNFYEYDCVYSLYNFSSFGDNYCQDKDDAHLYIFKSNTCIKIGDKSIFYLVDGEHFVQYICNDDECNECDLLIHHKMESIDCNNLELKQYNYFKIKDHYDIQIKETYIPKGRCYRESLLYSFTCYNNKFMKKVSCDDPDIVDFKLLDKNEECANYNSTSFSNAVIVHEYNSEEDCIENKNYIITYYNLDIDACGIEDYDTYFKTIKYVDNEKYVINEYDPSCNCCSESDPLKLEECEEIDMGTRYLKVFPPLPSIFQNITCYGYGNCVLEKDQEIHLSESTLLNFNLTISEGSSLHLKSNGSIIIGEDGGLKLEGGKIIIDIDKDGLSHSIIKNDNNDPLTIVDGEIIFNFESENEYNDFIETIKSNKSHEIILISGKYDGSFDNILVDSPDEIDSCEKINTELKENEDKTQLTVIFTINDDSCKKGLKPWIIGVICAGIIILIAAAFIIAVISSKTLRKKILPYRDRKKVNKSKVDEDEMDDMSTIRNETYHTSSKTKKNPLYTS